MPFHCMLPENKNSDSSLEWIYLASFVGKVEKKTGGYMSLQEQPGSFRVMFPAFSLPMKAERSRNKERLEASLAALCELELLKQRQECRVLSALCLGDAPVHGRPPWGALRSASCALDTPNLNASDEYGLGLQTNTLQSASFGIKSSLEQQVAGLKVNTEVKATESPIDLKDRLLSSGEVLLTKENGSAESNHHPVVPRSLSVPEGTGETETRESWLSDPKRQTMVNDTFGEMRVVDPSQEYYQQVQKVETYIFGLIQRRALPTRHSKPRTSLAQDVRAVSVLRQSSLCHKEDQHLPNQVSIQVISSPSQYSEGNARQACRKLDQEHYLGIQFNEDVSPPCHLQQSVKHQPGIYYKPRQASMVKTSHSTSPDYPSCSGLQAHQDSSNSEPDSPQHLHNYHSPAALSKPHQPPSPDEQLVSAEYIPAQPCRATTRAYAHHHSNPHKGSGVPKPNRNMFSPDKGIHREEQQPTASQIQPPKCRGGPKKCRLNEDRSGASRKPGKKACRSQSENSLQRVPERKCNTVERDGGGSGSGGRGSRSSQFRSKKQQQGSGSYRRWQSTLELSQDEADQPPMQAPMQGSSASNHRDHCTKRTRKIRSTHTSNAYPHRNYNHQHHSHLHHHQHLEYHLERDEVALCKPSEDYSHPGQGESESSMSEADSPDSSSLSSDSDESGGLVWPQQLPPQLSLPSPPAPPGAPMQPKAFVKIKASHALKKKILRFRTGSLKVMTTV
ncbi:dapper homolog 3-like [Trachinotus anak]|uniref:dapper homolog 3-like n=1 Tax=Trachinotus anak TaxID=443729 RepID=UPI0039F1CEE1